MIEHQTVGELRAALAELPDDATIDVLFEARCSGSSGIAILGLHDGIAVLDADGDDRPLAPRGVQLRRSAPST